jgi:hypothetical protein
MRLQFHLVKGHAMNALIRLRSLVLIIPLTAPLVVALAGCGGGGSGTTATPNEELKKSEASYEDAIAKDKAAKTKPGKPAGK